MQAKRQVKFTKKEVHYDNTLQAKGLYVQAIGDSQWGDTQVSCNALFDLDDGDEIIRVEVNENEINEDYCCSIAITSEKYEVSIDSNGRGKTQQAAILSAFAKTEIPQVCSFLEEVNLAPGFYSYRLTPAMEAIAKNLGVQRYALFSAGCQPLG